MLETTDARGLAKPGGAGAAGRLANAGASGRDAAVQRVSSIAGRLTSTASRGLRAGRAIVVVLALFPTILALVYYGLIASDRYESEARFVVRNASKPTIASGLNALLQMTGLSSANSHAYSINDFLTSRDAIQQLGERLPIREMYNRPGADFVARFPSLFFPSSDEQFHRYFQWMIGAVFNSSTGVSTLRVQAFRPDDAQAIATALLDLGEVLVNRMNERMLEDAVKINADQVRRGQERLIDMQIAVTTFRNKELMIDPKSSSVLVTELIGRLSASLAETQTQISELRRASPSSPQIPSLERRSQALAMQIGHERARIADSSSNLAAKLADYEALNLQLEFSKTSLADASKSLETARLEARRQQLYLERIVQPQVHDYPTKPSSLRSIAATFTINMLALLVGWLVYTGIREHPA